MNLWDLDEKPHKQTKLENVLNAEVVDLDLLRREAWCGVSSLKRAQVWRLLSGLLTPTKQTKSLSLKRKQYLELKQHSLEEIDKQIYHQINIDVLRTLPLPWYKQERVQESLRNILYCWAIQHPATGYVQGINDLLTPFFTVFLNDLDPKKTFEFMDLVESDCFYSLQKFIDQIQDFYTHQQPGIQKQMQTLKLLIRRIYPELSLHLENENVEVIQFSFRWFNCFFLREVSHNLGIRLWDTFLCEEMSTFCVYLALSFLLKFSKQLLEKKFAEIVLFLQNPPTKQWTDEDIGMLLSKAFELKTLYLNYKF